MPAAPLEPCGAVVPLHAGTAAAAQGQDLLGAHAGQVGAADRAAVDRCSTSVPALGLCDVVVNRAVPGPP
jgi:hypothetical protein